MKLFSLMKENTEYLALFIIVDDTKFQQGQENVIFFPNFRYFLSKHNLQGIGRNNSFMT